MDEARLVKISKYLSKHLRHRPERLGLELRPGGWVGVEELLEACRRGRFPVSRRDLDEVVERNDKRRFAFDESGTLVRAQQGHSVEVDLELEPVEPPGVLYHGTGEQNLPQILREGLCRMGRQYVHLSPDVATARRVGTRHGRPAVLVVDVAAMWRDGWAFYVSCNGVWLAQSVPPPYLRRL